MMAAVLRTAVLILVTCRTASAGTSTPPPELAGFTTPHAPLGPEVLTGVTQTPHPMGGKSITTTPNPVVITAEVVSSMTVATEIGATSIVVANQAGFVAGRQISIGVAPEIEDRVIVGFGSLMLNAPLKYHHSVNTPVTMHTSPAAAPTSGKCSIVPNAACTFPFDYKGISYGTCTGVDAASTLWCSQDSQYSGRWKPCTDPCKGKWSQKKIAGTAIAGGLVATGVGLTAAALANDFRNGHFNPFYGIKINKATTPSPPGTTGPPFVMKPATPGNPGVMGQMISVPRRLLSESRLSGIIGAAGAKMSDDATQTSDLWIVFAIVAITTFFAGCLYSLWVSRAAGSGKKYAAVEPEEEEEAP